MASMVEKPPGPTEAIWRSSEVIGGVVMSNTQKILPPWRTAVEISSTSTVRGGAVEVRMEKMEVKWWQIWAAKAADLEVTIQARQATDPISSFHQADLKPQKMELVDFNLNFKPSLPLSISSSSLIFWAKLGSARLVCTPSTAAC